jgi:hypothetical protein
LAKRGISNHLTVLLSHGLVAVAVADAGGVGA